MPTVAMSGNDTISINNRIFADLADADVVTLTFPNDISTLKVGKNGNALYGLNEDGRQCEVVIRLIRASSDDKFLNSLLALQQANFPAFPLMIGEFTKRVGDGQGNITGDVYVMSGGIFIKPVESTSNVEGDTDQSLSIYTIRFANAPRAIT